MTDLPLIEYRGVRKSFGPRPTLDGLDLTVNRREIVVLMGPSGSGKTVLLRLLVGLLHPDSGDIRFAGASIPPLDEHALRPIRRRIGFVFQSAALFDSITVGENVAFPLRIEDHPPPEDAIAARVGECLELVGLRGTEPLSPAGLSGGMRKRVGIARALATRPEALLYDEPSVGLDPANLLRVVQLIRGLHEQLDVTGLVVTHDRELAFRIADRIALLHQGRIGWMGPVREAIEQPPPLLEAFLAGQEAA